MESLFARSTPRRGRVLIMLAGSLVFHGGLVGIAALFIQPPPPYVEVTFPIFDEQEGPKVSTVDVADPALQTVVESGPTATPDVIDPTMSTPPALTDAENFAEPSSPTPRIKVSVKPNAKSLTSTNRLPASATASSVGVLPGGPTGGSDARGTASWVTPHPPYPTFARRSSFATGATTVRVTTDVTGRISNVVVVRSAGNPLLDAHTVSYVRSNWHGPANASRTTEFVYQLK